MTVCTVLKSKVMISQNFVAFSEYMNFTPYFSVVENQDQVRDRQFTLKSLINEQGDYVVFLVLSEFSFIMDFRVCTKQGYVGLKSMVYNQERAI